MRATIDSAGRLVVPKPLRDELGLTAGIELDVTAVDGQLRVSIPSRVIVEEGPHGVRFTTGEGASARLTTDQVRELTERGRR